MARTTKVTAKTTKPDRQAAAAQARVAAAAWWAWAARTLEHIRAQAAEVYREGNKPGSPLAGLFDADLMDSFAGRIADVQTDLINNVPSLDGVPEPLIDAEDES